MAESSTAHLPAQRRPEHEGHGYRSGPWQKRRSRDFTGGSSRLRAAFSQAEVDSDVSSGVAGDAELLSEAGLVLSALLGKKGIDFPEAAGLVTVFGGPRPPFGQFCVQALSALAVERENSFAPGFGSGGPVESLFSSLAVVTPGKTPATAEFGERFFDSLSFLASLGRVGDGPLLVSHERRQGVEGCVRSLVDDPCQPEPFGPERIDQEGQPLLRRYLRGRRPGNRQGEASLVFSRPPQERRRAGSSPNWSSGTTTATTGPPSGSPSAHYLAEKWLPGASGRSSGRARSTPTERNVRLHVAPAHRRHPAPTPCAGGPRRVLRRLLSERSTQRDGGGPAAARPSGYIHGILHKALADAQRKGTVMRNVAASPMPPKLELGEAAEIRVWTAA